MQGIGKIILFLGAILVATGLIIVFLGDKMTWFGNLPGDIHYKKDKFQIYAPLASMLLLSLVLGLIMWIARKIME